MLEKHQTFEYLTKCVMLKVNFLTTAAGVRKIYSFKTEAYMAMYQQKLHITSS